MPRLDSKLIKTLHTTIGLNPQQAALLETASAATTGSASQAAGNVILKLTVMTTQMSIGDATIQVSIKPKPNMPIKHSLFAVPVFWCDGDWPIGIHQVCNKRWDCFDGSDERDCSKYSRMICEEGEAKFGGSDVPYTWVCDGNIDCKDGSDEHEYCKYNLLLIYCSQF